MKPAETPADPPVLASATLVTAVIGLVAWLLVATLCEAPAPPAGIAASHATLETRPDTALPEAARDSVGRGPTGSARVTITEDGYEVRYQPPETPRLLSFEAGSVAVPPEQDQQRWTLPRLSAAFDCDPGRDGCAGQVGHLQTYDDRGLRRVLGELQAVHPEGRTVIIEAHPSISALVVTRVMDVALGLDGRTGRPLMDHVLLSQGAL